MAFLIRRLRRKSAAQVVKRVRFLTEIENRRLVQQVSSQDDDLLVCRAVLAFYSHASFPFQAEAGHNAVRYPKELLQQAEKTEFPDAFNA